MPDEKDKIENGWSMPAPVFRTSEGRNVKADTADSESDIPTEQADRELTADASAATASQTVRSLSNRRNRHKNKRRKSFWERNARGLIVLSVFLIGLLIYIAWVYRGKIL